MLTVDLHSHTFFSCCGIHTHLELLTRARELGMQALAITDHGPELEARITPPLFDRLKAPLAGIRLLKGMECNLVGTDGTIDLPRRFLKHLDLVLLGIHPNTAQGLGMETYTGALIAAMEKNPCVDIITHPDSRTYLNDLPTLCLAAREHGVAIEINNSRVLLGRSTPERMSELIHICKETGCLIAVNSDTHALEELGRDEDVRPLLIKAGFPEERIVNRDYDSAMQWIDSRRKNKE